MVLRARSRVAGSDARQDKRGGDEGERNGVLFRRVRPLLMFDDRSPRDDMSCMGRKLLNLQILKS